MYNVHVHVGREGPVPIPGEGSIPGLIPVPGEGGLILVLGEGDIQGLVLIPGDIPSLIPILDPGTVHTHVHVHCICNSEVQHVNL